MGCKTRYSGSLPAAAAKISEIVSPPMPAINAQSQFPTFSNPSDTTAVYLSGKVSRSNVSAFWRHSAEISDTITLSHLRFFSISYAIYPWSQPTSAKTSQSGISDNSVSNLLDIDKFLQPLASGRMAKFAERFRLYLTNTFTRNVKFFTDFFESSRFAVVKTVAKS